MGDSLSGEAGTALSPSSHYCSSPARALLTDYENARPPALSFFVMDSTKIWNSVLVEMELGVSKANFSTWFKDTAIIKFEDGVVFVGVPNAFVKEWLMTKYHNLILRSLRSISENVRALEYIISKGEGARESGHRNDQVAVTIINTELPLNDFYIDKENNLNPRY